MINYIKQIEEKLKNKKYSDALELCNSAIENDIENAYLYYKYMGKAEFFIGQYEQALENYKFSIDLNDTQIDIYYDIGLVYVCLEDIKSAIINFHKVIKSNPLNKEFVETKNRNYEFIADKILINDYEKLLTKNPDQLVVYINLSLLYNYLINSYNSIDDYYLKALDYIQKAIYLNKDNFVLYNIKALIYCSNRGWDYYNGEAIKNIDISLALNQNQNNLKIKKQEIQIDIDE